MEKSSRRIYELDSLRGIAAIMVILFHYTTKYSEIFKSNLTTLFEFQFGHYGVSLFFMISGFVIFMTIDSVKSSPMTFVYKRFIRLYPIFWVCLTLTFLVTSLSNVSNLSRTLIDYLVNFTMIPSLLGKRLIDGVYWSLVPELFFYGLIFLLILRNWTHKIILVSFVWLGISFVNLLIDLPKFFEIILNLKYGFLFVTGINFYEIYRQRDSWINYFQLLSCIVFCYFQGDIILTYFFLFFLLIFYAFARRKLQFLKWKGLVILGEISYVLYLLHQFIGYVIINKMIQFGIENYFILISVPLVVSLLLASLVTYKIEKPIIQHANNWFREYLSRLL